MERASERSGPPGPCLNGRSRARYICRSIASTAYTRVCRVLATVNVALYFYVSYTTQRCWCAASRIRMQASDVFEHLPQYRVIICKSCSHAVWPLQVAAHLNGSGHKACTRLQHLTSVQVDTIAREIRTWEELCADPILHQLPEYLPSPVPGLVLHSNGIRCLLSADGQDCRYVCQSHDTIRRHWRLAHQWTLQSGTRGGSGQGRRRLREQRRLEAMREVGCFQRFFTQGKHSHFIEVLSPEPSSPEPGSPPGQSVTEQIRGELTILED